MNEKPKPGKPITHLPVMHIETGKIYTTYKEAAEAIGGSGNHVKANAVGCQKHHKHQHFRYVKNN